MEIRPSFFARQRTTLVVACDCHQLFFHPAHNKTARCPTCGEQAELEKLIDLLLEPEVAVEG